MAKPFYDTLQYFMYESSLEDDSKISLMERDFDAEGFRFIVKLWSACYGANGYYVELDEVFLEHFCSNKIKCTREKFNAMLAAAIQFGLVDKRCYQQFNIITSKGIQKRYLYIAKKAKWSKIKMVKDYFDFHLDIDPYDIHFINRDGSFLELKPKVGSTRVKKDKVVKVKKTFEPEVTVQNAPIFAEQPVLINGMMPATEVARVCGMIYEEQNEKFKSQVTYKQFTSYVNFNRIIDEQFPKLRISNYQISLYEYVSLCKKPIDGIVPTSDELYGALRKLAANGVMLNYQIYLKLQDYIKYYREEIAKNMVKQRGFNNQSNQPEQTNQGRLPDDRQKKIDHAAQLDQFLNRKTDTHGK